MIEGFILAGGASSRMGVDKAHLRLGGLKFVERVAQALSTIAERITVVSSKAGGDAWGLRVVPDVFAERGALGGLHSAFVHARTDLIAVVSCDLPFVTGELFGRLVSLSEKEDQAVVPVQEDLRPQPLCALYAPHECLKVAESLIQDGELRPRALLQKVRTRRISFEALTDLDGAGLFFSNVNTPADFEQARLAFERRAGAK